MSNDPNKPGHEPDPDPPDPGGGAPDDAPDEGNHDAENIEEVGEPFDGNFA